jgi:seryl-tRNA synthetase
VLIPIATMERCDYFASFPHHITFAPHLKENVDSITEIATTTADARGAKLAAAFAPVSHLLSPAVCFHTYAWLADRELRAPLTITAVGRCFRWESANLATVERLWDFTMREIVFVGPSSWVEDRRTQAMEATKRLVGELELDARIELANDPFFVTRFASKRFHQLLTRAKYELKLTLPYSGGALSAASFNIHEDFFGRAFGIRSGDGFAATGCAAFGVERWVWALFAQHGPSLAEWPRAVKSALDL